MPPPVEASAPDPTATLGHALISRAEIPQYLSDDEANQFLERLREDLVSTGLFESVEIGDTSSQEVTVIYAEWFPRNCFSEPLITVVTLGVIPNPGCYYSGYRMRLQNPRVSRDIVVDDLAQPWLLWGWLAGPISIFPGWSWAPPVAQERERLRASIRNAVSAATAPAG